MKRRKLICHLSGARCTPQRSTMLTFLHATVSISRWASNRSGQATCCAQRQPQPQPKTPSISIVEATLRASNFQGSAQDAQNLAIHLLNSIPSAIEKGMTEDGRAIDGLYKELKNRGTIQSFGSVPVAEQYKISLDDMVKEIGFPVSALAPKQSTLLGYQLGGVLAVGSVVAITRYLDVEYLARPILLAVGLAIAIDQFLLSSAFFDRVYRAINPGYTDKILRHECGHAIVAYLLGLPLRGFVLTAWEALNAGVPGQAGTLFYDEALAIQAQKGRISKSTINRSSMVLMAGIAAESIYFDESVGGESDVNALVELLRSVNFSPGQIQDQARWAIVASVGLIRANKTAFEALAQAMKERKPLGDCISCIEQYCPPVNTTSET